jgi:Mg-chelatase subunit ChlD
MFQEVKGFLTSKDGNTGIMLALTILPLMLGAGAAVDMLRINQAQLILQAAVDSAALSAAATEKSVLDNGQVSQGFYKKNADQIVRDFMIANDVSRLVQIDAGGIKTTLNAKKSALKVKISGRMETSLMKLAGINEIEIEAVAEVALSSQALEVALVLDNTGSMRGQKLVDLKSAANSLVGKLHEKSGGNSYLKIGVVPFSEYVNVGINPPSGGWLDSHVVPANSAWEGCVGSRSNAHEASVEVNGSSKYPRVGDVNCVTELLPLTSDQQAVEAKINSLSAKGYTYIPSGLMWGWNILSADAPYTEGMDQDALAELGGDKVIVLMTDGANTISSNGALNNTFSGAGADQLTASLCANAKADKIQIFTVSFQVNDDSIKDLLQSCASGPEMAFNADSAAELSAAFNQIGNKLADLYLKK